MNNQEYLNDSSFLKQIDNEKVKEQHTKITVMNFAEQDIQSVEGSVISGSISIDGDSSVRRTCNLTIIADEFENDITSAKNIFSLNKKVRVEVGFTNNFKNKNQPKEKYDIIWFPMGTYVICGVSISNNNSGVQISLQLKDKMCLLNGDVGGIIPSSVTFHEYDTIDENGSTIIENPTIYQIIQELVNHFGNEQLPKIIINDVDLKAKQLVQYNGTSPLYRTGNIDNNTSDTNISFSLSYPSGGENLITYEYGDLLGYLLTDFTYPGDLISNEGDNVCTILDKIRDTLGNYEYYYDVNGNFIFQEIKNYLNTTLAKKSLEELQKSDSYLLDMTKGKSVYTFEDSTLISAYSNSPQQDKIKNDFVVWGTRTTASGLTTPIRYHLAIDKKPTIGNTYKVILQEDEDDGILKAKVPVTSGVTNISELPHPGDSSLIWEVNGSYYQWKAYTDTTTNIGSYDYIKLQNVKMKSITTKDWRTELYLSGAIADPLASYSNYYYTELENEWTQIYDIENGRFYASEYDEDLADYQVPSSNKYDFNYFLDFIDTNSAIDDFSIDNIGRRSQVITDDTINCLFAPDVPDLIFIETGKDDTAALRQECKTLGYEYTQVDKTIFSALETGDDMNSAYDKIRENLYQCTSQNESISLTTIPIYYLEPNTRITVNDPVSGMKGDYIINSMTIPLDIGGTMTIQATRALEKL